VTAIEEILQSPGEFHCTYGFEEDSDELATVVNEGKLMARGPKDDLSEGFWHNVLAYNEVFRAR
jgi:hypothetical protein